MFKTRLGSSYGRRHNIPRARLTRDRANLSFFIVIFFFTIFGVIIITEVLMMDDKGRGQGISIRKGGRRYEYDDQNDDYPQYQDKNFDTNLAAFLDDKGHRVKSKETWGNSLELQMPTLNPNMTAKDDEWQTVAGTRSKFLVYSAYYDDRFGRNVRVIAATKTRGPDRVWCRFWYSSTSGNKTVVTSFSVPAHIKMIRENWNLRYSACFLVCPLRQNMTVPASLSVVSRLKLTPSNLLAVQAPNKTAFAGELGLCVKPLHFDYNKAVTILEFIELYRLLGVKHFTLYNHTIGSEVSCILQQYQEMGLVDILPWQMKMKSQKEIRTEGLFAALNDCLYRNMYKYAFLAMVDLDEFIIPRKNGTLIDLIRFLHSRMNPRSSGSFSFQNAFFYLQWPDDPSAAHLDSGLVTLRKTRRKVKLHPHKQRSKYICRPELVVEAGNHFVWEFLSGYGTVNVSPDSAFLHHYRVCEFGGDDCIKASSTVDKTAFRFKEKLLDKLSERWQQFQKPCGLSRSF